MKRIWRFAGRVFIQLSRWLDDLGYWCEEFGTDEGATIIALPHIGDAVTKADLEAFMRTIYGKEKDAPQTDV